MGTIAVVTDPHEIANVLGLEGIRYILDASENLPLRVFVMFPSCVPATPFETSGAELTHTDMEPFKDHPRILGLAEMMNFPGVIHGDPHLGNYSVFSEGGEAQGINLLDYGCVRIFPPRFVGGVVDLYQGLLHDDQERVVHAYETWGFKNLRKDLVEVLNVWARFIYGPLLDDRVRTIANGVAPGAYGRQEAFTVHKALKEKGPVTIPREFVFMDRAAIGLGGVFLHLNAELNFFKLFNEAIADFSTEIVAEKQAKLMEKTGLATH